MLDSLYQVAVAAGDVLLGWSLHLPWDLALAVLALVSSLLFIAARKWTTQQRLLQRCTADKRRLRELLRAARARNDLEARRRHRALRGMVLRKQFAQELKAMWVALIPIAALAAWAWQRLEFVPPKPREPIRVRAFFPVSAAGQVTHLVPQAGLQARQGWIQEIHAVRDGSAVRGVAEWMLTAERRADPYPVQLNFGGRLFAWPLAVGLPTRNARVTEFGGECSHVEIVQDRFHFLGLVPGLPWLGFPPWLVAYVILTPLFVAALKRLLRIY